MQSHARIAPIAALVLSCTVGAAMASDNARLTPIDVIKARALVSPAATPTPAPPGPTAPGPARTIAEAPRPRVNPAHEGPSPTIQDLVAKHAHDYGVPVGLATAVIKIESRFNPRATNHGALGLMQIKAGTARSAGFSGEASALLTPDTNLHYGMKVLADAYHASNGDVCRTLAYYQSGSPARRFTPAERSYCAKARAYMAHA